VEIPEFTLFAYSSPDPVADYGPVSVSVPVPAPAPAPVPAPKLLLIAHHLGIGLLCAN